MIQYKFMDSSIFSKVDAYIGSLSKLTDEAPDKIQISTDSETFQFLSVSPNQGRFLQVLAKTCNAKKILEIGTFVGYSTIWMARALPQDGKLISLELNPDYAAIAQKNISNCGLEKMVDIRIGKAIDILQQLIANEESPFDMIFIDADKPPYTEYFELSMQLSRPGTLIVADNVIRAAKVLDTDSADPLVAGVQRFNQVLFTKTNVTATILQTVGVKDHDGMALAVVH